MQRTTELRHLSPELRHKISTYLEENNSWKRLMSIVPKNAECYEEKKYTNEQIDLIATPRQGDNRLPSEIFLEEWATSGRKEQRPTLGTLLINLVRAELFGVADYIAEILDEPPPNRPENGPGARIEIELPSDILNGVASYVDDSTFYPNTEDINVNAIEPNGISEKNQDFYTKYRHSDKTYGFKEAAPRPAPRTYRKSERLQKQEKEHNLISLPETLNLPITTTFVNDGLPDAEHTEISQEIKQQATLKTSIPTNGISDANEANSAPSIPLVSMLLSDPKNENDALNTMSYVNECGASLPLLSVFDPGNLISNTDNLPVISALNLDGHLIENCVNKNEQNPPLNSDFEEGDSNCIDEDEDSLKNLESSNNDSSLTNVTGTSGDNSFELSSSSTSNENIPLNVLNFSR